MSTTILGTGVLTWFRRERISDRYGTVYLAANADNPDQLSGTNTSNGSVCLEKTESGSRGTLAAVVLETRQSDHIGDLFRGLSPSTPNVGDRIILGTGTLFFLKEVEVGHIYHQVGLKPDDGRKLDWLDPEALYRCHEQTVRLEFVKDEMEGRL